MYDDPSQIRRSLTLVLLGTTTLCTVALAVGCRSRLDYRRWADVDVSDVIAETQCDPRWQIPPRPVEADPRSRMADRSCPDCGPLPPDDPAAHCFMEFPDRFRGWPHWHSRGDLPFIEFPDWRDFLPRGEEDVIRLNRDTAIELARIHSRQYQDQVEQLYFTALAFTLEQFEFHTQWFYRSGNIFDVFGTGGPPNESRMLTSRRNFGFTRDFAAGGQLLVDFANAFVWEFAGDTVSSASSNLLFSFTQPFLRNALREVRLENLTQAQRDLLYAVRDFVRFRRVFYVDTAGGRGYLGLLTVAQRIKNQRRNLDSLQRNLDEHEQLSRAGQVAPIQVDEVFQEYMSGRLNLLAAEQALETELDLYKFFLGLPPQLEIELDEEALQPFQLNNPEIEELQAENEELRLSLIRREEPPSAEEMKRFYEQLKTTREEMETLRQEVGEEWDKWDERLEESDLDPIAVDGTDEENQEVRTRQRELADELETILDEFDDDFAEDTRRIEAAIEGKYMPPQDDDAIDSLENKAARGFGQNGLGLQQRDPRTLLWESLKELVGKRIRKQLAGLFVVQAQVRVYLIEIFPVELDEETIVEAALQRRLDLKNARGIVIDAFRRVEVAADALEGELNLELEAELGTDPNRANPVGFDASANRYRVGVEFDGPLNRFAERNAYRRAQILYQQARRSYMELEDAIARDIRLAVRTLKFNRFSFVIARLQLLTAARQVDQAQLNLRGSVEPTTNLTRDLLLALQRLLDAQNDLITSWVSYETSRMVLFRDLDVMQIADDGTWINESNKELPGDTAVQFGPIDEESGDVVDDDNDDNNDNNGRERKNEPPRPRELEFLEPEELPVQPPAGERLPVPAP